ncbi:energy transducer TonB [Hymenobacter aquaticus]|uniref:Energy transducer TonB n=1 Tax=Hymenobacter aquaticus TaxID=1867101 RepID=A0A4Z0PUE7_9BACT|nr:energy transducer TonB [Hymenobacter aquaticus]TGE21410.1 energy transducer TonB [Hymenobacter aquaticus]
MLNLPLLNVRLSACPVAPEQLTPTAQGHYCASCQRPVHDFTAGTQADLAAARAASPDGRVCGQFRREQLAAGLPAASPRLRPRLRRFVVALTLVCGLGLSAREAVAQVRKAELNTRFRPTTELRLTTPEELSPLARRKDTLPVTGECTKVYTGAIELMPTFPGGIKALHAYMQHNLHYPDSVEAAGKVFITFLVTSTGAIANAKVMHGIDPVLDAEALRVVRQMPAWTPGQSNGKPSNVAYTLPITFSREAEAAAPKAKGRRRAGGR